MEERADFFLSAAGDNSELATPRACWARARLRDEVRDDYMLIEITPPLIGQKYSLGEQNIRHLLLSTRLSGFSLFPVNEWPCPVYISRIRDESVLKTLTFTGGQVELIAWGMIFDTLRGAEESSGSLIRE